MKYLLDTCTFFWFVGGDARLSSAARNIIADDANVLGVSIVSFWEMAIKSSLGKLELPASLPELESLTAQEAIEIVPVTVMATQTLSTLPFHHNDPFDRTIIAIAMQGEWSVLTPDSIYDRYPAARIW